MSVFRVTTPDAGYHVYARSATDAAWRVYRRLMCRVPLGDIQATRM